MVFCVVLPSWAVTVIVNWLSPATTVPSPLTVYLATGLSRSTKIVAVVVPAGTAFSVP